MSQDTAEGQPAASPDSLVLGLAEKGIHDKRLLDAFKRIGRVGFVPIESASGAYVDRAISIGHDQGTTQPFLVALMVQALHLTGTEKVLEIGTGLGFQTAILSALCQRVFSIEVLADLANMAESNLRKAGIVNAQVAAGDGSLGLPDHAPFDAIIVSAAAPHVPQPFVDQLKEGGVLVQPIGPGGEETVSVTSFQKVQGNIIKREQVARAFFVPLLGAFGVTTMPRM